MRSLILFILIVSSTLFFAGCGGKIILDYPEVRVAMFNIQELSTEKLLDVDENGIGQDSQALASAAIIKKYNPDILVINEIDYDYDSYDGTNESLALNLKRFAENYLSKGSNSIEYKYFFAAPNNTGLLSGMDLDNDGDVATDSDVGTRVHGNDAFGYGAYPGQYSMGIMSRYPIKTSEVRTFQKFLWKDLPDSNIPTEWYNEEEQNSFRLSSKSHWDVPIVIGKKDVHLFVSHPTPPVFDGPEDRNGLRNFDEIRFWAEYINNSESIYDDQGRSGGFAKDHPFVIAGDLNASIRSEPIYTGEIAINNLLNHPKIADPKEYLKSEGGLDGRESGPPNYWENATASFLDGFRADYLLPSKGLKINNGGVYWPAESEDPEGHTLIEEASDHRFLWLDISI